MGNIDGDGADLTGKRRKKINGQLPWYWPCRRLSRECVSLWWTRATHFSFPRKILRVLCGYFEHQRRVRFEGCAAEPLRIITAFLPGSKWSCLLSRIALPDALSEVTKVYTPPKLRAPVDDITALLKLGKRKEGDEEVERRSREKRPQIVSHRKSEGRKEQDDCVMWVPGK